MNNQRKPKLPHIMSGRRVAGKDVERVVIEYVQSAKVRGMYDPATKTLTLYRVKGDESRILLMI